TITGASESVLPGTAPAEALHTFTLDSGAACCFFRDNTNLTPLPAAVPVRLADPSEGPVLARSSTVLPCPAVPSGSLSGLHLPSFSTNLVSTAALQDAMVTTTTPGGQRVSICTCTRTGRHLATFTRRPGSSLYTLATEPPQVAASAQTLLWHHRLGHPFLPRLRGMHSHLLVSGLPRSHPPLPPSPAPPCLPCVEGRQCAAPHSSSFPQMTAPLQTLHMDVWGPARVIGQGRERYFLLVVDNYTRYTTIHHAARVSHGGRSYLHDPCGGSPCSLAVCSTVCCASAQPLAAGLLAGDLAHTASTRPKPLSPQQLREWLTRRARLRVELLELVPLMLEMQELVVLRVLVFLLELEVLEVLVLLVLEVIVLEVLELLGLVVLEVQALKLAVLRELEARVLVLLEVLEVLELVVLQTLELEALALAVLGLPSSTGLTPPFQCPPPDQSQPLWQSAAPLPAPAPYTEQTGRLRERRDRESCPASLFRTGRRVPRLHPPPIPDTHAMALRPSSVPLRVPLRAPPESSLPAVHDPESDCARAASPTVSRLLATVVSDPSFESTAASALVAILVEFAALCRLDYATALLVETESYCPLSVGGECALGTDALEDRREDFDCLAANVPHFASMLLALEGDPDAPDIPTPCSYADAITGPYSSQWQAAMDAEMASWKSTGTYTDAVPPSRANIVAGTSLPSFYDLVYVDDLVSATAGTEALTLVKSEL
ncbi:unnamed protein product, partial [Closterium sp. NIES-54]